MEPNSKMWYFQNFNILSSLSKTEMEELSKLVSMRNSSKNQIIYFPEDTSNIIYFLKAGKVKISKYSEDGKELILAILGPGEIFGELAVTGESKRNEVAEAVEDAIVCGLSMHEMQRMFTKNPKLNLQITKLIGFRLKKVQARFESLCFKNTEDRVKSFIKELADDHGKKIGVGDELEIKLNLTHDDISKLTAVSRQNVTGIFNSLEKNNIILYDRKRILVKDYASLS
ncbi:MAG: Crp/Fnr family transcriptional regulator [Bacteroidetes bacterium]|nr:Crp/Fnr family transcriptional regulator [Bacteroidota bacterium]